MRWWAFGGGIKSELIWGMIDGAGTKVGDDFSSTVYFFRRFFEPTISSCPLCIVCMCKLRSFGSQKTLLHSSQRKVFIDRQPLIWWTSSFYTTINKTKNKWDIKKKKKKSYVQLSLTYSVSKTEKTDATAEIQHTGMLILAVALQVTQLCKRLFTLWTSVRPKRLMYG